MVVVDYLQLMTGDRYKGSNRYDELTSITRALKNLSKELSISVIALSQLNRSLETRGGDKRPQLSDLLGSGTIEEDADIVLFLYRPEYYGITMDEYGTSTIGRSELIISKYRLGRLDTVNLKFLGRFTKFCDTGEYTKPVQNQSPFNNNILRNRANDLSNFGNAGPGQETPF